MPLSALLLAMSSLSVLSLSGAFSAARAHTAGRPAHFNAGPRKPRRASRDETVDPLEASVLLFAQRAIGQQVGAGECFDLADQALHAAGAQSAADFTEISPDGAYVWGRAVPLAVVHPGDVLQFSGFRVTRRVTSTRHGDDGTFETQQTMQAEDREHHTAIVEAVSGGTLTVLEQNMDPAGRIVQRNRVDIAAHTERIADPDGMRETVIETDVQGDITAYRPLRAGSVRLTASSGF